MTFADEMALLVVEMLEEFGAIGTLTTTSEGVFDPITGGVTEGSTETRSVLCAVGETDITDDQGRFVAKSPAAFFPVKPTEGDVLLWAGITYNIGKVTALPLQGQIVAYRAEVR